MPSSSVLVVLALLLAPATARAQAALLTGLGGPAAFGERALGAARSAEIDLGAAFPDGIALLGGTFTTMFVNEDGAVTFGAALDAPAPVAFDASERAMIAPLWTDIEVGPGGGVYWAAAPDRIVVTWHEVGGGPDGALATFQIVLMPRGGVGDWDLELRYGLCEWGAGAAAGFSDGRGNFVELPGSRTWASALLCSKSNVDSPGLFRFTSVAGQLAPCGDGRIDDGETCDDRNPIDGDGCSRSCQREEGYACAGEPTRCDTVCGDGIVAGAETCDDADTTDGDGCSAGCTVEVAPCVGCGGCGDGVRSDGEACDDGGGEDGDGCSASCRVEVGFACVGAPSVCEVLCGDRLVLAGEGCDDGNRNRGDGCSEHCAIEPGFACDASGCAAVCGDGACVRGEACDDGNDAAGDGCDACAIEPGFACSGEPSRCVTFAPDAGASRRDGGAASIPDAGGEAMAGHGGCSAHPGGPTEVWPLLVAFAVLLRRRR